MALSGSERTTVKAKINETFVGLKVEKVTWGDWVALIYKIKSFMTSVPSKQPFVTEYVQAKYGFLERETFSNRLS